MASPPNDEYKNWPFPLSEEMIKNGPYLKSLNSSEELADFSNSRYYCLMNSGKGDEAFACALTIEKLAPNALKYASVIAQSKMQGSSQPILQGLNPEQFGIQDPTPHMPTPEIPH
jgi:hypothetical protein